MMLLFQIVCLLITLLVLQKYVVTGTNSRTHRLLPLILELVATYNFLELYAELSGETALLALLKHLVLLQSLHLMLFYALDFLHIKLPNIVNGVLLALLLLMDAVMLYGDRYPRIYEQGFLLFILWYIALIVGLGTYAYIHYSFTKREHRVTNLVYVAFLMPVGSLFLSGVGVIDNDWILSASFACTCIILYYLLATEQLDDTLFILQEQLYATADIAIISFDADYYYLGANQAAKNLFPVELSVPAAKSKPEKYLEDIRQMSTMMDKPRMIELSGRYYKCQLGAVSHHGRLKGYNLSIIDITEQKNETQRMASLKEEAEDKTASKSRFLATMSHDLRSPLHAIIGISDILTAKREISSQNRSLLLHIKSAGETLLTQVDAILDYSKLESGKLILTRRSYNLDTIVDELAHMSAINLQKKPVRFTVHMCDEHPKQLIGDEMRVREIIQNLLANAVKYTKQGEINCDITCRMQKETRRAYITCSVRDTGRGMNEEQIAQIFEEYVSFADENASQGAGLGLCIVKQLAELMGGWVTVTSDGVSGSTVTASFYQEYDGEETYPAFSLDGETILRQTTAFNRSVRPTFVYPGAKVLLAEDMRINQEIFRELTAPWKFEVVFAENGKEAVQMAKTGGYQMIFLDQMMPEMMGDMAAVCIREFSDVPLILMTANLSDGVRNQYLRIGFTDFVPKPIQLLVLQQVIEQHMPREWRRDPVFEETQGIFPDGRSKDNATRRTLETFIYEVEPLAEELPGYVNENLELFRIKMHGIKGASRQIGKVTLSERAEVLEMAAKTENMDYIRRHLQDFRKDLEYAVKETREELANIPSVGNEILSESIDKKEMFARLKAGFDNYELGEIEECIATLECAVLTAEELEFLEKAKGACNEMDYEAGSALFS